MELFRGQSNYHFPILQKHLKHGPAKNIIIINKKRFNIDTEATKISRTSSKLAHPKLAKIYRDKQGLPGKHGDRMQI